MPTIRQLILYLLASSLPMPVLCASVADAEEHELALIESLPLLAEPDLDHSDGGFVIDERELAIERSTPAASWMATVEYADPVSPAIQGKYGFALSNRHARGFRLAFARDRKEIVLSEAFAFGSKTMLRLTIGNTRFASGETVSDLDEQLVERTRSVELMRRVFLPQTAIEIGIGGYAADGGQSNRGEGFETMDAVHDDAGGVSPGRRRELSARLSVAPESFAVRFDLGAIRHVSGSLSGAGHGGRNNGYRVRAFGQLQQCRALDIEYSASHNAQTLSAHFDATTWRVGLSAARADGALQPSVSLSLAIALPLDGAPDGSTGCGEEIALSPMPRELVNEVTVLQEWLQDGG